MPRGQTGRDVEDVTAFLNARDLSRPVRREHHLPTHVYRDPSIAFHLTKCVHSRRPLFEATDLAGIVIEAIENRRQREVWRVYAYCLMPDHLHLVCQLRATEGHVAPKSLHEVMGEFCSWTAHQLVKRGVKAPVWQHDVYDRAIRSSDEFEPQCLYVLNNPVRAGLVEEWTEWPWSGVPDHP